MEKKAKLTLSESVYERIHRDILTNRLKPGEKINIRKLCERYEASETPVRLALNRLAAANIIEYFPRQGMRVKTLDIGLCEDTFELRRVLECYCIPNAVMSLSVNEAMRSAFQENVREHMAAAKKLSPSSTIDDYLKNYELDLGFHQLLIRCSGNQLLMNLYQLLNPFLYVNYVYSKQSQERLLAGTAEHEEILQALLDRDGERAARAVERHLSNARQTIISILKIEHIF